MTNVQVDPDLGSFAAKKSRQSIVQCPECQTKFAVDSTAIDQYNDPRFHCSRCDHIFELDVSTLKPLVIETPKSISRTSADFPRGLEIPKTLEPQFEALAPHESTGQEIEDVEQLEFDLPDNIINKTFGDEFDTDYAHHSEFISNPALASAPEIPKRPKGVLALLVPVLVFLGVIVAFGLTLQSSHDLAASFSEVIGANSLRVAPPGLYVKSSRIKKVVLSSGESLYLLSGTVRNDTSETFSEITGEGILFDQDGMPLISVKALANSALADTRVKSLSLNMIQDLQTKRPARRLELQPGQEQPLSVALYGPDLSKAKHYLLRLYSISN